jgi:hypothetical protein
MIRSREISGSGKSVVKAREMVGLVKRWVSKSGGMRGKVTRNGRLNTEMGV